MTAFRESSLDEIKNSVLCGYLLNSLLSFGNDITPLSEEDGFQHNQVSGRHGQVKDDKIYKVVAGMQHYAPFSGRLNLMTCPFSPSLPISFPLKKIFIPPALPIFREKQFFACHVTDSPGRIINS